MQKLSILMLLLFLLSCSDEKEKTKPSVESISESIYASGFIKSKNQYQVFATVNGILSNVFIKEGDSVIKGTPLFSIANETQKLNKENAELAAIFADKNANTGKLVEAKLAIDLAKNKMLSDSSMLVRQQTLFKQQIGSKAELEQRELAYQQTKNIYATSVIKYNDLKRQIDFNATQAKNNLQISQKLENDFVIKSQINGVVYGINKTIGEIVSVQTPLATVGDATNFILELQVDEYDILKIKVGLPLIVKLDSYKEQVFEATITRINPMMNERTKTFLVEAEFANKPEVLYPNITFEANIILNTKENALLIPRNYMVTDSTVLNTKGEEIRVKTGLKDFQKIEILAGLSENEEITKPAK